jgi:hypothetical protein
MWANTSRIIRSSWLTPGIGGSGYLAATSPSQLVGAAEGIFQTDLDAGYITVLVEMIAGSSSTPSLGPKVASRIQPWREFVQSSIESALRDSPLSSLLPAQDVAHAMVALYLGLEMLSHLDGDAEPALSLFVHPKQVASRFEALTTPATTKEST